MLEKYLELLPQLKFLLFQLENTLIPKNRRTVQCCYNGASSKILFDIFYLLQLLIVFELFNISHPTTLRSLYGTICLDCELQTI